jgi:hypothetical protein
METATGGRWRYPEHDDGTVTIGAPLMWRYRELGGKGLVVERVEVLR